MDEISRCHFIVHFIVTDKLNNADAGSYFYTRDHLGSIREMTDSTATVRVCYDYDPYGKRTKLKGDLDCDFGFTGHYHHAGNNLNMTLYRAYDTELGRWLSADPIGEAGGVNLYGYVEDNPINLWDPLGLVCWGLPNDLAGNDKNFKDAYYKEARKGALAFLAIPAVMGGEILMPLILGNPGVVAAGGAAVGSTADKFRRTPINLLEQLDLEAAKRGEGMKIIDKLGDPCFKDMEKWQFVTKSAQGVQAVVHYVRDPATGKLMDFKFK